RGNGIVVLDPEYNKEIDLLQAGQTVAGNRVPMPRPTSVNTSPQICDLPTLIDLKIGSFLGAERASTALAMERVQDRDDVYKLMTNNNLPKDFLKEKIHEKEYAHMWEVLHAPSQERSHEAALESLLNPLDFDGLVSFHKAQAKLADNSICRCGHQWHEHWSLGSFGCKDSTCECKGFKAKTGAYDWDKDTEDFRAGLKQEWDDPDGYLFRSETYCPRCGRELIDELVDTKRLGPPGPVDDKGYLEDSEVVPQPILSLEPGT